MSKWVLLLVIGICEYLIINSREYSNTKKPWSFQSYDTNTEHTHNTQIVQKKSKPSAATLCSDTHVVNLCPTQVLGVTTNKSSRSCNLQEAVHVPEVKVCAHLVQCEIWEFASLVIAGDVVCIKTSLLLIELLIHSSFMWTLSIQII